MGWLIGWADRKSLVEHLCSGNGVTTIARFFSGNNLWTVQETKTGDRFICLYQMTGGRNQDWGYKDVEETMGPYQDTCPLSFFDMVPCPDYGYAVEFRERCRAAHAKKQMPLAVGQTVTLTNGKDYKLTQVGRSLRGYDVVHGYAYRIPRRMLVKVVS